jgi:hypothetical protein
VGDFRTDPAEELETKDAAEDIASCRAMDQTFLAAPDTAERSCSLDKDRRSCWPKETARGLIGNKDDFEEGELVNFMFNAEKLHFFEGVLRIAGAESGGEYTFVELELRC